MIGKQKRKRQKPAGFTLIETLIVIVILAMLAVGMFVALNPGEHILQTGDLSAEFAMRDFASGTNLYELSNNTTPWENDPTCGQQLSNGKLLTDIPACINDLVQAGHLSKNLLTSDVAKRIYVAVCNDEVALCYNPKSQKFNQSSDTAYTQIGILTPSCPSTNGTSQNCYSCIFSNPAVQQCLQTKIASPTATPMPTLPPIPTYTHVWVGNENNSISRFNLDGTSAGSSVTGNGISGPWGITDVGSQIWVTNVQNSISRFNSDMSSAGSAITGNGLNFSINSAIVGSQIWTVNTNNNEISRFNYDGSPAASPLTGNGIVGPYDLAVVGTQVWVVNSGGANIIARFNSDGSSAGVPISNSGMTGGLGIAVVGTQVWVTSMDLNYNSYIYRFNFDGTSAGSKLTGNGLYVPYRIAVIGSQVWVTNAKGNSISRFNFDGSSAGSPITGNGLDFPTGIGKGP